MIRKFKPFKTIKYIGGKSGAVATVRKEFSP
jgi:hypothetical protein